ncbi:hypothetical protein DEM25_014940 [Oceaniradius stylonematis]|uniref:Lipoprotein n=1 Tax=Oceaniradius stylonematis TaxID=2184161 RepID=A0A3A8A6D5_9HYPH|nr:hypothetical protein DEM25_014940 [Oceaniradius stylonematis]
MATLLVLTLAAAACTTPDDGSNTVENALSVESTPGAAVAVDPNAATTTGEALISGSETAAAPQAFAANAARVHFAPIVGAPVDRVAALSRRLSASGARNNISILPSASSGVDHEIRGYFSALSENGQTTVIHVWDVFTPSGQRVHRIQGQERVPGTNADPWQAVPASAMERIADTMLSDYNAWRGRAA